MEKRFFRLLFLFITLYFPAVAQQNEKSICATNGVTALQKQNPEIAHRMAQAEAQARNYLKSSAGRKIKNTGDVIPVVFHVLYNNPTQNISEAQLRSQIEVLNQDFNRENSDTSQTPKAFKPVAGNPKIVFCMAILDEAGNPTNGITRTFTTKTEFDYRNNEVKAAATDGHDPWNPNLYLNIWVCNLSGNVLGYAQFPGGPAATDGVVIKYRNIGAGLSNPFPSQYNLGRTTTHEVGHWLGLQHIWGDDQNSCTDSDHITDTPNQAINSEGCPVFPHISCNNGPNGDMFMNFMDYSDDRCMNLFTKEQSNLMNATLQTSRASLLASKVCSDEINADFRAEPEAIFPGDTVNFFYYSNGRRPDNFSWTFEGGEPAFSTQKNPQGIRYDKPGNYTVSLTVWDARDTATVVKKAYVHVTTKELEIYPNPANANLTVSAPAGQKVQEITVYNTAGKLLLCQTATERMFSMPVSSLKNGLYLVQAKLESGKYLSRRLLILR